MGLDYLLSDHRASAILVVCRNIFMKGREDDEAVFIVLDEAVHWVVFVLVELHFLAYSLQVKDQGRVRDEQLEADFTQLPHEVRYLPIHILVFIANTQHSLDPVHHWVVEWGRETLVIDGPPVGLVGLSEDVHYRAFEGGGGGDLLQDYFNWGEILLNCFNNDGDGVLEKEYYTV
jgi:hypothetical protein